MLPYPHQFIHSFMKLLTHREKKQTGKGYQRSWHQKAFSRLHYRGPQLGYFFLPLHLLSVMEGEILGLENVNCGRKSSACMDFSTGSVMCVLSITWGHSGISEGQKQPCRRHYLLHVCGGELRSVKVRVPTTLEMVFWALLLLQF